MWNRQFTYNKLCKTPLWNHLGSNKLHTREPSDTTGYIQNKKNFTMWVRLLCGAHVVWDCLFNTGYPGFGVPVPLFIGYLISNLILLKTSTDNSHLCLNYKRYFIHTQCHYCPDSKLTDTETQFENRGTFTTIQKHTTHILTL